MIFMIILNFQYHNVTVGWDDDGKIGKIIN